jgi:hypothetical protein
VLLFAIGSGLSSEAPLISAASNGILGVAAILILTRFGLLPLVVGICVSTILPEFPMTTDPGAWYSGSTMTAIGAVLALAAFAFYTSRAGRTA